MIYLDPTGSTLGYKRYRGSRATDSSHGGVTAIGSDTSLVLPTAWVKKEILTFLGNCSNSVDDGGYSLR